MKFNKIFKIVSISLFAISVVVGGLYVGYGSSKDCLGCKLAVCEGITPNGEKYLLPADECAMTYEEIAAKEQELIDSGKPEDEAQIDECSQECLDYAGNFMSFTIVMSIIATVITLLFALYTLVINPKKIKGVAIGLLGLCAAVGLSYVLASDSIPKIIGYNSVITPGESKFVGTMVYLMYILLGSAVAGILLTSIYKMIKK